MFSFHVFCTCTSNLVDCAATNWYSKTSSFAFKSVVSESWLTVICSVSRVEKLKVSCVPCGTIRRVLASIVSLLRWI